MKLEYNFTTGNYAVYPEASQNAMQGYLDTENNDVHTFDISHWTEDDFIDFVGLGKDDQVAIVEKLTAA